MGGGKLTTGPSSKIGKAFSHLVKAFTPPPAPVVNPVVSKALPVIQSGSSSNTFTSAAAGIPISTPKPVEPPTTEAEAALQIDAYLRGPQFKGGRTSDVTKPYGGEILRDPADVIDPDGSFTALVNQRTQAMVEANRPLEQAALARLSPEDHALYDSILAASEEDQDPRASLALQGLLFEGKLTDSTSVTNTRLLNELARLADPQTPMAPGIDRLALVTDTVQELATPSAINQHDRGTCVPTAVSVDLATVRPAEYARIVGDLASPSGEVTLASGLRVTREPGTELPDETGRSVSQKLIAPVFMEVANEDKDYNDADGSGYGALPSGTEALFEAVNGHPSERETLAGRVTSSDGVVSYQGADPEAAQEALERIQMHLSEGRAVLASIQIQATLSPQNPDEVASHQLLVTGTESDNGVEYVKYINPWGQEERMKQSDFVARLTSVNYPREYSPFLEWQVPYLPGPDGEIDYQTLFGQ